MKELKEDAGYFPILWFGNRNKYEGSDMRIITVALNPSETEFRNDEGGDDKTYRFQDREKSYNEYFNYHPYYWFNNFEYILRGLGASYGGNKLEIDDENCGDAYLNRAIHTDLCTPYATRPAWTKLSEDKDEKCVQRAIAENGIAAWKELVEELKPQIMIFSLAREWWGMKDVGLKVEKWRIIKDFVEKDKKKEKLGKRGEMNYYKGIYKLQDGTEVLAILGITNIFPFGDLDKDEKRSLGKAILEEYKTMTK